MNRLQKVFAVVVCLCLPACVFALNNDGSRRATEQLSKKVFEMLKKGQYEQAKRFLSSIPVCPTGTVQEKDLPAYCAGMKFNPSQYEVPLDIYSFTVDVKPSNSAVVKKDYPLSTVHPWTLVYNALGLHYRFLYGGQKPSVIGNANKNNYLAFYDRYKNSWLKKAVRETLYYWNDGENKWLADGRVSGKILYNDMWLALYTNDDEASQMPFFADKTNPYNFNQLKAVFDEARQQAVAMKDDRPFFHIRHYTLEEFLTPYYYGADGIALQRNMQMLGAEDEAPWKLLAVEPLRRDLFDNAQKIFQMCWTHRNGYGGPLNFVQMNPKWCTNFKKHAEKYLRHDSETTIVRQINAQFRVNEIIYPTPYRQTVKTAER